MATNSTTSSTSANVNNNQDPFFKENAIYFAWCGTKKKIVSHATNPSKNVEFPALEPGLKVQALKNPSTKRPVWVCKFNSENGFVVPQLLISPVKSSKVVREN